MGKQNAQINMEKITINFLGTGSAIPTAKRNHTAMLLTYKNENILIDCGEGTQRQFKKARISPAKITRILITHWHGDHTLGIPGLLQTLKMTGYSKTLHIYGPKGTKEKLELFDKIYNKTYDQMKINLEVHEISSDKVLETPEFKIEAKRMQHGLPSLAYSFAIKDKLRLKKDKIKSLPHSPKLKQLAEGKDVTIDGKKIKASQVTYKEPGRKIAFVLDTGINENAIEIAKDSDILICESSFTKEDEQTEKDHVHLTAEQAATIAKKAKAKQLILTHISQRHEHNTSPVLDEAKKVFKNTKIVKDLDVVEL